MAVVGARRWCRRGALRRVRRLVVSRGRAGLGCSSPRQDETGTSSGMEQAADGRRHLQDVSTTKPTTRRAYDPSAGPNGAPAAGPTPQARGVVRALQHRGEAPDRRSARRCSPPAGAVAGGRVRRLSTAEEQVSAGRAADAGRATGAGPLDFGERMHFPSTPWLRPGRAGRSASTGPPRCAG